MSVLREVKSSLLEKQNELRESILQEVVGDRSTSEDEQQS